VDVEEGPAAQAAMAPISRRTVVARGVFSTFSGTTISNVTGVLRQFVLAWVYGAGRGMDAFLVASVLSQMVFASVDSALSSTLIPVYSGLRARSEAEAEHFLAALSSLVVIATAVLGLGLYLVAPALVHLLAPGFAAAEARQTVLLVRILMPSLVFMGLSSVSVGFLQAHGRFGAPAVMFIPRNILLIVASLLWGRRYGTAVLAWGTMTGAVLQLAVVLLPALRRGAPYRFLWQPLHAGIRTMLQRLPAVYANFFMYQAALIVDRILASGLPGGMIAALNYAQVLLGPPGTWIMSLAVALFPTLSDLVARGERRRFARAVGTGLRLTTLVASALTLYLIFFRDPLVAVFFQHGAFQAQALRRTAFALAFFALGFVSIVWNGILGRAVFALGETQVLLTSAAAAVTVTIATDLLLIHPLRQGGLALGTSLGSWASTFLLLRLVSRRVPDFRPLRALGHLLGTAAAAAAAFGVAAWILSPFFSPSRTGGFWGNAAWAVTGGLLGSAGYVGALALSPGGRSQLREFLTLGRQVLRRSAA